VDHHVTKYPTGAPNVFKRRWRGIATDDSNLFNPTDSATNYLISQRAMMWIESTMKAERKWDRMPRENLKTFLYSCDIEVYRFLAEDRLSGLRYKHNHLDMGVRRGTNEYRSDSRIADQFGRAVADPSPYNGS
jgi:hypothetical protein